jgi:hypothetical protein
MRVALSLNAILGRWALKVLEDTHNYGRFADLIAYLVRRIAAITLKVYAQIDSFAKASVAGSRGIARDLREGG